MKKTEAQFSPATHGGCFTVTSVATGEHRTFQLRRAEFGDGPKTVLEMLTGSDNTRDYTPFAFVFPISPWAFRVKLWGKHKGTEYEKLANMVQRLHELEDKGKIKVQWAARCRRCNRKLTTPESLAAGIGPDCAGKEGV